MSMVRVVTNEPSTTVSALRARRKARSLTQEQLAERVGCDQTMVSAIELGTATPSLKLAQALASELETTLNDLFGEAVAS